MPSAPNASDTRRLNIWIQNSNRSRSSLLATLADVSPDVYDIIAIQEPYVSTAGTVTGSSRWTTILPHAHGNGTRARSVFYVNSRLATDGWEDIPTKCADLTGLRLVTGIGIIDIYNIYDDQESSAALDELEGLMDSGGPLGDCDYIVLLGDFNAHHALWEPPRNAHLWRDRNGRERGERLVSLIAKYGFDMALPAEIPTLETHGRTKNRTRPDNVFCSAELTDFVTECDVREEHRPPRTDHFPYTLCIDAEMHAAEPMKRRNWRMADWDEFDKELGARLDAKERPRRCRNQVEFQRICRDLDDSMQGTIAACVPLSRPSPYRKRWWSKDLEELRSRTRKLSRRSAKLATVPDHPVHQEAADLRREYGDRIEEAKQEHWDDWLENADSEALWTAHKYTGNAPLGCKAARTPTLTVTNVEGQQQSVRDNPGKGRAFYDCFFPKHPDDLSLPELDDDSRDMGPMREITRTQIRRIVNRLAPYKAPGPDGIPNIVWKRCLDRVLDWLYWIFRGCTEHGFYYDPWREFITVVLRKPGRPSYAVPKAYRPVALYNTLAKILSACVAEDLSYLAESRGLLPATHFGGRPRRSTTDALHIFTATVKDAWRNKSVVSALVLDTAGAFPNAVPERLCHNMRELGIPEGYVRFVEAMLRGRRTFLRFDDFQTAPFDVDNGIGQGDPLSMILYLFYNHRMLRIASGNRSLGLGFVDDIAILASGKTFTETHALLEDIMEREGGGCDWSVAHNSPWEFDKTQVIDFCTAQKKQYTTGLGAPLTIRGTRIANVRTVKYLGVYLDSALRFKDHVEKAAAKGSKYVAQMARLARTSKGLRAKHVRRLYIAVAAPKMTYAADVWFQPVRETEGGRSKGSVAFARSIAKVQRTAALSVTGALRSSPNELLDIHADFWPAHLLLEKTCYRSALRMCTLTDDHPTAELVARCARRPVKHHPTPIHTLLRTFSIRPDSIEKLRTFPRDTKWVRALRTFISESREQGIARDAEAQGLFDVHVYSDGSADDHGVGAAAVLMRDGVVQRSLRLHLGSPREHTTFEAEAVGAHLALHLIAEEEASSARMGIDNTGVIKASKQYKPRSGHYLVDRLHTVVEELQRDSIQRGERLDLRMEWTPGHEGLAGNEAADAAAKLAAKGPQYSSSRRELPAWLRKPLPASVSALRRAHTTTLDSQWHGEWSKSKRLGRMAAIDPEFCPRNMRKLLHGRRRWQTSLLTQFRIGHAPLNKHLHRIQRADSASCAACGCPGETVRHYIMDCPAYASARWDMRQGLGNRNDQLSTLLSSKRGIDRLLKFVQQTGRFSNLLGKHPFKS